MWTIVHYLHPKEPSHMTLDCQHSSFPATSRSPQLLPESRPPGLCPCFRSGSQTILEICRGHVHRKRRLSISIGGEGLILSQYNNLVLRPLSIRAIDHTASE